MLRQKNLTVGDFFDTEKECPICHSTERRVVSKVGKNLQPLETVMCTGCGLVHSNPIPTKAELDQFYSSKYRRNYKFASKPKLKHTLRYAPGSLERVNTLIKYKKTDQKKLIDIGSGSGEFLYMASKAGFDAQGIEPHIGYCEYTKSVLGLDVANSSLENADLEKESFDIVNLNHVLEHMPEPLETLILLRGFLKNDGILMVDVPDISTCRHAPWTQFHYAHIYNFNHDTLKALAEKAGFEILNKGDQGTNLILKKVLVEKSDVRQLLPENYEAMWNKLNSNTMTKHYKTKKPYSRFIRKFYQYPKEFLVVAWLRSPRKILDKVYRQKGIRI